MQTHLQNEHRIVNGAVLKAKIKENHIGHDHQVRFWCGFCGQNVGLKENGVKGWDERFNHIDEHFKNRCQILDWIDAEANKTKREIQVAKHEELDKAASTEEQHHHDGDEAINIEAPVAPQSNPLKRGHSDTLELPTNSDTSGYTFCVRKKPPMHPSCLMRSTI
jgi:hypothetical protein